MAGEIEVNGASGTAIAAVIVHFNTPALTQLCIESLLSQTNVSVTVLDNASTNENWKDLVGRCSGMARLQLHRSPDNLGFGWGVNRAVQLAQPSEDALIWIVNSDMKAEPGAASALAVCLQAGKVDLVGSACYSGSAEAKRTYFLGGDLDIPSVTTSHWNFRKPFMPPDEELTASTFLSGCSLMLRATTWKQLRGFREDLFLYWEDADLCFRALNQGLLMGIASGSLMWHAAGASSSTVGFSRSTYYFMARNRIRVGRSWGIPVWGFLFGCASRETYALCLRPLHKESVDRLGRMLGACRGTLVGFLTSPTVSANFDPRRH